MAYFRCKPSNESSMSDYSEYILIYDCDIEWNGSSWWDIVNLKEGNKVFLMVNNIYMNQDHIIDSNEYQGYYFLKTTIGLFDTIEEAIEAFNNSDILSHQPVQRRIDYYYVYYAGYNTWGWDWTRPYYASKTFKLRSGNKYDANPHPNMKPKVS